MAGKEKITRARLVCAGVELIRSRGEAALNARALAGALHCSTQPIFRHFPTMEALHTALLEEVHCRYLRFMEDYAAASDAPPYKASGLAYVAFAKAEPELFRLLFMRGRSGTEDGPEVEDWAPTVEAASRNTGLPPAQAELFHLELWALVHGIAVMQATGYLDFAPETVSQMLTDVYRGLKYKWEAKQ